jgi:hypothetical protein
MAFRSSTCDLLSAASATLLKLRLGTRAALRGSFAALKLQRPFVVFEKWQGAGRLANAGVLGGRRAASAAKLIQGEVGFLQGWCGGLQVRWGRAKTRSRGRCSLRFVILRLTTATAALMSLSELRFVSVSGFIVSVLPAAWRSGEVNLEHGF